MGPFRWNPIAVTMSQVGDSRNDEWNSDRPKDESQGYDGPAGMEPDGLIESNWEEVCENFDDMNLKEELLRGIYAYGFEKPSAIQQRAIVPCIKGMDVIAQAQSGTGKTATFSIAILEKIDTGLRECQALILAPIHCSLEMDGAFLGDILIESEFAEKELNVFFQQVKILWCLHIIAYLL